MTIMHSDVHIFASVNIVKRLTYLGSYRILSKISDTLIVRTPKYVIFSHSNRTGRTYNTTYITVSMHTFTMTGSKKQLDLFLYKFTEVVYKLLLSCELDQARNLESLLEG